MGLFCLGGADEEGTEKEGQFCLCFQLVYRRGEQLHVNCGLLVTD